MNREATLGRRSMDSALWAFQELAGADAQTACDGSRNRTRNEESEELPENKGDCTRREVS